MILASPETERGPGPRAIFADPSGISRRQRWKGTADPAWFIITAPRPRLRNCVFHAPLQEGFARLSRSGHGPRVLHRAAGPRAAPCPAKGKQERRRDTKEWNHADGTDGIAARRLRDRRGTNRRDVERRASPRARHHRRMALLRRQGRRRRMAAMQHRENSMGQPRGRHHHARRPRPAARKERWMLVIRDWWFTDEPFGRAE